MTIKLTLKNDTSYRYRTDLDGVSYFIEFNWNERDSRWFISLLDGNNELLASTALVLRYPLWNRFRNTELPAGVMFLSSNDGSNDEPSSDNLADQYSLFYSEAES